MKWRRFQYGHRKGYCLAQEGLVRARGVEDELKAAREALFEVSGIDDSTVKGCHADSGRDAKAGEEEKRE